MRGTMIDRRMRLLALALAVLCALPFTAPDAAGARERLTATTKGRTVTVKGWATFSGTTMAAKKDSAKDGDAPAADTGAEITGASLLYRPEIEDLFLRIDVTKIPSTNLGAQGVVVAGHPQTLYGLRFGIDNHPYVIRAHSLGGLSVPGGRIEPAIGLFRCDENLCTEVARLKGGYGTTGERITVSLPLAVLRADGVKVREGSSVTDLLAFTAVGTYVTGEGRPPVILDQVRLAKSAVTIPRKSVHVTVEKTTRKADLAKGIWKASFAKGLFARSAATPVRTRSCLGRRCVTERFSVRP
jgi:hypothetical protein